MILDQLRPIELAIAEQHPLLGLARQSHLSTREKPLQFRDRPFLIELYKDFPEKCEAADIRKGVQVGISEWLLCLSFYIAGWKGLTVAYILPTSDMRNSFVQKRVDPLFLRVAEYKARSPGGDLAEGTATSNLRQKRFGRGSLLFLGSNTPVSFVEFSADMMVIDEYDIADPTHLGKVRDRVRESDLGLIIRVGNPTLPRIGISRAYDQSDGRRWCVRCNRCGERQPIDWYLNVVEKTENGEWRPRDRENAAQTLSARPGGRFVARRGGPDIRPVCRRCRRPFDRGVAVDGRHAGWVAERPNEIVRGYTCGRPDILSDRLADLFVEFMDAQHDTKLLSDFHTGGLGMPWERAGAVLTVTDLEKIAVGDEVDHAGGDEYADQIVTAGVDVGSVLNVTISVVEAPHEGDSEGIRRAVYVGAVLTFEEVKNLFKRFHVKFAVIDSQPEGHAVQGLRDYFREEGGDCQVWLARFYPTPKVGEDRYGWTLNWEAAIVTVDRTQVFDATFDDIKFGRRLFPKDVFTVFGFSEQMTASKRVLNEEATRIVWSEGSDPDHFRCADIYDRIAYDLSQRGATFFSV